MKKITCKVTPVAPDFQTVKVQILSQTHINSNFGDCSDRFTHCGFTIASAAYPEVDGANKVFVRGHNAYRNNYTLTMPITTYAKFKAAVEAYNKYFACVPAPAPKKADVCTVIIG